MDAPGTSGCQAQKLRATCHHRARLLVVSTGICEEEVAVQGARRVQHHEWNGINELTIKQRAARAPLAPFLFTLNKRAWVVVQF